ncbi:MAG: VOC family protein [Christensenellaceae bacterium]|jgi:catechol 2,3-dioxygenase-like lactoylglutathione lyase family enzyme
MRFQDTTIRILVRKEYGACFDFYTEKLGLVPVWGDRNGPYTSFAIKEGAAPCFAIFSGANMSMFDGYAQPKTTEQPDSIVAVIPSDDLDGDYEKMRAAGVEFLSPPRFIADWQMRCTYFRDTEGNLFELNDAAGV